MTAATTVKATWKGGGLETTLPIDTVDLWLKQLDNQLCGRDRERAGHAARKWIVANMLAGFAEDQAGELAATLLWLACRDGGVEDAEKTARLGNHTFSFEIVKGE